MTHVKTKFIVLLTLCALAAQTTIAEKLAFTQRKLGGSDNRFIEFVIADFNGDGHPDVFSKHLQDTVRLYLNDGAAAPAITKVFEDVLDIDLLDPLDVDLDGDIDILVEYAPPGMGESPHWLENDGADPPSFTLNALPAGYPIGIFTDLNADGAPDALMENGSAWFESNGASPPIFTEHTLMPPAEVDELFVADIADIDGDNDVDFLMSDHFKVIIVENDGAAVPGFTFIERATATSGQNTSVSVQAADMDADGDLDLFHRVHLDNDTHQLAYFENQSGSFATSWTSLGAIPDDPIELEMVDFDGDGDLDMKFRARAWYEFDLASEPKFKKHFILAGADRYDETRVVDFNSDGRPDIISAWDQLDELVWLETKAWRPFAASTFQHPTITFQDYLLFTPSPGDPPALLSDFFFNTGVRYYEKTGGAPNAYTLRESPLADSEGEIKDAGDIDGDGDEDLLAVIEDDFKLVWLRNDGGVPINFVRVDLGFPPQSVHGSLILTDIDNDNDLDVVGAGATPGVFLFENDGAPAPSFTMTQISTAEAAGMHAGDFDDDNDVDLVTFGGGDVYVLDNDGQSPPTFTTRLVDNTATAPNTGRAIADLTGDGRMDLAGYNGGNSYTYVYRSNNQSPATFTKLIANRAALGDNVIDVDGDGDLDFAGVLDDARNLTNNDFWRGVGWFENIDDLQNEMSGRILQAEEQFGGFLMISSVAGDLDLDGDADIAAFENGRLTIYSQITSACLADMNGDFIIGAADLAALIGLWGQSETNADLDGSGVVGAGDLAALIGNWGPCP